MTQTWNGDDLVLSATEARTYYVTFTPNDNYEWATGVKAPTYFLVIERYVLDKEEHRGEKPFIAISDKETELMNLSPDAPDYPRNKITIQGGTKTVQYTADNENKFIKLYVGGNSLQVSVTIKNSNGRPISGVNAASLYQDWSEDGYLTLDGRSFDDGTQAENYLISIEIGRAHV